MTRLDLELVHRGLVASRTRAAAAVAAGLVRVDGTVVTRSSALVGPTSSIDVSGLDHHVSRAAHKLLAALETWQVPVQGRWCLDVGASTGGFTQVLCERGAAQVVALDVGHGQLHPTVAGDPRVVEHSGVSVRDLRPELLDRPVDLVVADLSFISLTLALQPIRSVLAPEADLVLLVKPQFELDRSALDRRGVVRTHADRVRAVRRVVDAAGREGFVLSGLLRSPVLGQAGNVEVVSWWRWTGREMMSPRAAADDAALDDLIWRVTESLEG